MPVIMIFQKDAEPLRVPEISESMAATLGVPCFVFEKGRKLSAAEAEGDQALLVDGQVWVELPDLEEDEGEPIVTFESSPRLDREDPLQEMIDEIVKQEPSLDEPMNTNQRDVLLTFDESMAGIEAGNALAYIIAAEAESGLLIPGFEDDQDTLWFDSADDFADAAFGEDEDEEE